MQPRKAHNSVVTNATNSTEPINTYDRDPPPTPSLLFSSSSCTSLTSTTLLFSSLCQPVFSQSSNELSVLPSIIQSPALVFLSQLLLLLCFPSLTCINNNYPLDSNHMSINTLRSSSKKTEYSYGLNSEGKLPLHTLFKNYRK